MQIDNAALDCWTHNQLLDAEVSLATATLLSQHVLASRALVRARMERWDEAAADAEEVFADQFPCIPTLMLIYTKSIAIQPSVMGYVAKSVSLVGKGKKHEAYRVCDIAFEHLHSTHVSFLLLIKVSITGTWSPLRCSCD